MKEDFLHHVWKYKLFDQSELRTTDGRKISIVQAGFHNHDAGPDFSQATIFIDNIQWNGNVEIHIKASDWHRHQHQDNVAYDTVILHVVYESDKLITIGQDEAVACLELKNRISPGLLSKYESLLLNKSWIACENSIESIDRDKIKLWLHAISIQRLHLKSQQVIKDLEESTYHWEMVFHKYLFKVFGLKVNQEAFTYLFESLPFERLAQASDDVFRIEALLFGQAGFLSESHSDDYPRALLEEYSFLKHKYALVPIAQNYWKFARMRPANFPTIRLAQLSQLLHRYPRLFQHILEAEVKSISPLFADIEASPYWNTHYRFDDSSKARRKLLGKSRIDLIIINAVVPMLFSYGSVKKDDIYIDKALDLLDQIPAEKNSIINQWAALGIDSDSALQSQSLLHLKKEYCDKYKCIQCQIGVNIISQP